ncbi:uncharacterized protein LOC109863087 [Pseudomyrmex gracilis]|uniref:uncharacterized protein LOC109863087 n=1 Tax=Pseudomyrmex gracilis TaxID=219809 RepID=UPI000995D7CD|nr:uncharacterized protein LOC109863087 [Pseudomyrmex gracilis]XP_020298858.1 uncharacterized protein LOC109863087 [Pseudomyrmex gracilis]
MKLKLLSKTCQIVIRKFLGIVCFLLLAPFLITILMVLYIYRCWVKTVLRIQLEDKFAGLLEGSDAFWSVKDTSLSLITVVLIMKKTAGSTNTTFIKHIRKLFTHLSKTVPKELDKLFYYRYQKFGYFYWKKSKFNPETAIRWLECEISNCDGSCENVHSTTFQENLGFISNRPLYDDHKPMWEMLIGRRCPNVKSSIEEDPRLSSQDSFNTELDEVPVVFRVHHSLGDGKALFKLLNVFVDEDITNEVSTVLDEPQDSVLSAKENYFKEQETNPKRKIILNLKGVYNTIKEIIRKVILILFSLEIFVSQIVRNRMTDGKSSLHGRSLSGEKFIVYRLENDTNKSQLLTKIKKIRQCTGAKVTDIILTAFAAGIIKYYLRMKEVIPNAISVLIPRRLSMYNDNLVLTNDISINIVKSCLVNANKNDVLTSPTNFRFFERLQRTTIINNKIRSSLEASLNFFLLEHLLGILPGEILKLLIATHNPTMAFSNIKGIQRKLSIQNHPLSNMLFWIPNKNTTGLSLSVITYEGKLNLSLLVDKAVIRDMKVIREILDETIYEIDSAYNDLASFEIIGSFSENTCGKK